MILKEKLSGYVNRLFDVYAYSEDNNAKIREMLNGAKTTDSRIEVAPKFFEMIDETTMFVFKASQEIQKCLQSREFLAFFEELNTLRYTMDEYLKVCGTINEKIYNPEETGMYLHCIADVDNVKVDDDPAHYTISALCNSDVFTVANFEKVICFVIKALEKCNESCVTILKKNHEAAAEFSEAKVQIQMGSVEMENEFNADCNNINIETLNIINLKDAITLLSKEIKNLELAEAITNEISTAIKNNYNL